MNSDLLNIENIDPIIVQYLIDKMTAKIEKRRNSQRDSQRINKALALDANTTIKIVMCGN